MAQLKTIGEITTIFAASAASENSGEFHGPAQGRAFLIFSVVGSGWTGSIKAEGQVSQSGAFASVANVGLTSLITLAAVAGGTGATADGLFQVEITGMRVRLAHARTAGSVTVVGRVVATDA
jgi:hypothetical protein